MTKIKAVIACGALVGAFLFSLSLALARDPEGKYAGSANHEWFRSQHNSDGQWCCDESDGHLYDGGYTINEDGSVTVDLKGKPHTIPKNKVLTGSNPTGSAVWWFLETVDGHYDYCFAPGSLT
jgi:hypothetical protein